MDELSQKFINVCHDVGPDDLYEMAQEACDKNDLLKLKFLLTDHVISKKWYINTNKLRLLRKVCVNGYLDIVKYLLTSPDLPTKFDIHMNNDEALQRACENNRLNIVEYLLTSEELEDHADVSADDLLAYRWAVESDADDVMLFLLSDKHPYVIDFQKTQYNLDYAIREQRNDLIVAMMCCLARYDIYEYLSNLPHIQKYSESLYKSILQKVSSTDAPNISEECLLI